ncbi:MAG TPA: thiol:disulfide interchange protein DsbA/DsbL [Gammaproteobacteria bacterium]
MIRACRRIVVPLGLLLLAACGAGDPQGADRGLAPAGDEAALEPEDAAARPADAEEAPTSARFQLGVHYERLSPTQPTSSSPDQIEVAEVFWYGCPHCYAFEPYLERWAAQKPADVSFVRIPALWNPVLRTHARAFYTAQVLGKLDEMHSAFFNEIHENGNPLDTREALAEFFARFGVDAAEFERTFDSYDGVHEALQRAEQLNRAYRITSVPTIVVNGKYTTNATLAGSYEQLIELIDELVESERLDD